MGKTLFGNFSTPQIIDKDNYTGHVALTIRYESRKKEFEDYFNSIPDNDLKEVVQMSFFNYLKMEYYRNQESLARKFLEGKIVQVKEGIVKANADPEKMDVRWVEGVCPLAEKERDFLLELSYGSDSLGRIIITKESKIKIIGDILG